MKIKSLILIILFVLVGCNRSNYQVISDTDKFADVDDAELRMLKENYIKPDFFASTESQLNPYVFISPDNIIADMGFYLINVQMGNGRQWQGIGIKRGYKVVFLVDNDRVAAIALHTDTSTVRQGCDGRIYYTDKAWYSLTKAQMKKICMANALKIQIIGAKDTVEYGSEFIENRFYKNNQQFFENEIIAYEYIPTRGLPPRKYRFQ